MLRYDDETSTVKYTIYVSGETPIDIINSYNACLVKLYKCFCNNQMKASLDKDHLLISIKTAGSINIDTTRNRKFSVKNFSCKCYQIPNFLIYFILIWFIYSFVKKSFCNLIYTN